MGSQFVPVGGLAGVGGRRWSYPQGADGSAGAWRLHLSPSVELTPGCRLSVSAVGIELFDSQARVLV